MDCTITVDADLLEKLITGKRDPIWALICGDIRYKGDFAVARAFAAIVSDKPA